jgi:hypothetical protein
MISIFKRKHCDIGGKKVQRGKRGLNNEGTKQQRGSAGGEGIEPNFIWPQKNTMNAREEQMPQKQTKGTKGMNLIWPQKTQN